MSRNAIVIIVGSLIAYSLTEPGNSSFPFTLTGMKSIGAAINIINKYYIRAETCTFLFENIIGTIPSGFPPFKAPAFTFQNEYTTYTFVEICKNLGSALYITPLVAILESIAIAKSLGTCIIERIISVSL